MRETSVRSVRSVRCVRTVRTVRSVRSNITILQPCIHPQAFQPTVLQDTTRLDSLIRSSGRGPACLSETRPTVSDMSEVDGVRSCHSQIAYIPRPVRVISPALTILDSVASSMFRLRIPVASSRAFANIGSPDAVKAQ